jgi:hypothetical protein
MEGKLTCNQCQTVSSFISFCRKDDFTVECPHLGKLNRINIGHDNSSKSPEWFLDKVTIEDLHDHKVYEFPCNRWFDKKKDDGKIVRDLPCGRRPGGATSGKTNSVPVVLGGSEAKFGRMFLELHAEIPVYVSGSPS